MLLSSEGFADHRTESNALNLLEPRFGNLARPIVQSRLLDAWFGSSGGKTSAHLATTRILYRAFFDTKRFLEARTPAGRWLVTRDLSWV